MISIKDLSPFERDGVLDYLASLPEKELRTEYTHDAVFVEASFTRGFFVDLHEAEIKQLTENGGDDDDGSDELLLSEGDCASDATTPSLSIAQRKPIGWLQKFIQDFYVYRWKQFHLEVQSDHVQSLPIVDDVSVHTFQFLSKKYGVAPLVKKAAEDLLSTVKLYRTLHPDLQLFGVLLCGATYDTKDVRFLLQCRNALTPYVHHRSINTTIPGLRHTALLLVRSVPVRDIPFFLRKCLGKTHVGVLQRSRRALSTWCDPSMRFPGIVEDPNFYTPPFMNGHPYIGSSSHDDHSCPDELRFASVPSHVVVDEGQLLLLMLLNFKQEQLEPTNVARQQRSMSRGKSMLTRTASQIGGGFNAPALEATVSSRLKASEPSGLTPTRSSPALKRRDTMRRAAEQQPAVLQPQRHTASADIIDLPTDFNPFSASPPRHQAVFEGSSPVAKPTDAASAAAGGSSRALSMPLDIDIPFVAESDNPSFGGIPPAVGSTTPSTAVADVAAPPYDPHGSTNLPELQGQYDTDVRVLENKLNALMAGFQR